MKQSKSGFTIVELLIVIVVIGILAAIVIVAYSGVTKRARDTQTIAVVAAYRDAFILFNTVNGYYPGYAPVNINSAGACLGTGYPGGVCWTGSSPRSESAVLDAALQPFLSSKPTISTQVYAINGSDNRSGAVYSRFNPSISYYLGGTNQDCQLPGATASNHGPATHCLIVLPSAS